MVWDLPIGPTFHRYSVGVIRARGSFLLIFIVAGLATVQAQPQQDVSATDLLRLAVDKFEAAKDSKTRFTYLQLNHIQNFNEKGKKTVEYTQLYEVTYIVDLEYLRLLEVDGKALKGEALKVEQRRYDEAVRERSALDGFARARIQNQRMLDARIKIRDLETEYRVSAAEHDTIDDCQCILIDLVPVSSAAKKHYRLWIDPVTSEIRRLDFEQLAFEGEFLSGGKGTETFQYLDGVPLIVHSHFDGKAMLNDKTIRVVADHTYSRFRKFSVTTTIVPLKPEDKP
jgi:hypothetical protein